MINLQLQELNFTLFTEKFNPTILNLNTLQQAGVIQPSWKLAEEPIYQTSGLKLVFNNKVRIVAQPDKIVFAETVGRKRLQDITIPQSVANLVPGFAEIRYRGVSINPGGYAQFKSAAEACKYMSEGLLASTPWQKFQGRAINAVGLKLAYPYKSGSFYLDINQANLQILGKEISAVWFAGNFSYQLKGNDKNRRHFNLIQIVKDWNLEIQNYQDFIDNELLAVSVIPSVSIFPL